METTTIHPAEAYLRNEQNSTSLYVRIAGQRRRLSQIGQALRRYTIRHPLPKMQRT